MRKNEQENKKRRIKWSESQKLCFKDKGIINSIKMTEKRRVRKATDGDNEETTDILSESSFHKVLQCVENFLGGKKVQDFRLISSQGEMRSRPAEGQSVPCFFQL